MSDELDAPKWVSIAAAALERVNRVPHGSKGKALADVAAEFDLSENHIRRMMRALLFTTELSPKHPELAQALRSVTFKTAELIDRWHQHAPAAAIDAAERYVSRRLTFRALLGEYSGKRSRLPTTDEGAALDLDAFRTTALRKAKELIGIETIEVERPKELKHLTGIDHLFQERIGPKRWAVLVVLPGQAPALYLGRRELDLGRALALWQLKITPIFVLPESAMPDDFKELLTAFSAHFALVAVVKVRPTYV